MKLYEETIEIERSEDGGKEIDFGIEYEDMPQIMDLLRNKMYENKIRAILREYSTNAVDANIEGGNKDKLIKVDLPTRINPCLKIRDFGPGLSEDEITRIYTKYGKSTKRDSNEVTGALGLGCKSAFCYTDMFQIISWNNGTKTIYTSYIDESKRGKIRVDHTEKSTEPNGIQIVIPVTDKNDLHAFVQEAKFVYRFFNPRPEITGYTNADIFGEEKTPIMKGDDWRVYDRESHYHGTSYAVMGNIGYPINLNNKELTEGLPNSIYQFLSNLTVEFDFAIGDLSFTASREGLEYNKNTISSITEKAKKIAAEILVNVDKEIRNASSFAEANRIYANTFGYKHNSWGSRSTIRQILAQVAKDNGMSLDFKWKGRTVNGYLFKLDEEDAKKFDSDLKDQNPTDFKLLKYNFSSSSRTKCGYTLYESIAYAIPLFEDMNNFRDAKTWYGIKDTSNNLKKRINAIYKDKGMQCHGHDGIYLFTFKDAKTEKRYTKKYHLDEIGLTPISEIEPLKEDKIPGVGVDPALKAKHSAQAFVLTDKPDGNSSVNSNHWKKEDVDLDEGGIFVKIDKFRANHPSNGHTFSPFEFRDKVKTLKEITGKDVKEVYGFKQKTLDKMTKDQKKKWTNIFDVIQKFLDKLEKDYEIKEFFVSDFYIPCNKFFNEDWKTVEPHIQGTEFAKLIKPVFDLKEKLENKDFMGILSFYATEKSLSYNKNFGHQYFGKKILDFGEIQTTILKEYTMLNHIGLFGSSGWSPLATHNGYSLKNILTEIGDYARLVEGKPKQAPPVPPTKTKTPKKSIPIKNV